MQLLYPSVSYFLCKGVIWKGDQDCSDEKAILSYFVGLWKMYN